MNLGLAGAISGAGEGASRALTMGQAQWGAERLQAMRDAMDELRQQRLLEHQSAEGRLTREAAATNTDKTITAQASIHKADIESREGLAGKEIASREKIAGDANAVHKEIAAAANATHLLTAKLTRQMQEQQFDKNFTQAKLSALKDTVRELGTEITRLSVVVSNPLADKESDAFKSASIQLESATRLHNLYAKQVGLESGIGEQAIGEAITKPPLAPFRSPTAARSDATRTPGMVQVPPPSSEIQRQMDEELQRRGGAR